ncbi:peptidase M48, partial [bacterium]|nr:peptidase M48 [bacterium]
MVRKKRSLFQALMLVLLAAVLLTCAVNPVTGKRELMLLSEADEVTLGQQTDAEVIATYGLYEDAALTAYVAQIGHKMAALS